MKKALKQYGTKILTGVTILTMLLSLIVTADLLKADVSKAADPSEVVPGYSPTSGDPWDIVELKNIGDNHYYVTATDYEYLATLKARNNIDYETFYYDIDYKTNPMYKSIVHHYTAWDVSAATNALKSMYDSDEYINSFSYHGADTVSPLANGGPSYGSKAGEVPSGITVAANIYVYKFNNNVLYGNLSKGYRWDYGTKANMEVADRESRFVSEGVDGPKRTVYVSEDAARKYAKEHNLTTTSYTKTHYHKYPHFDSVTVPSSQVDITTCEHCCDDEYKNGICPGCGMQCKYMSANHKCPGVQLHSITNYVTWNSWRDRSNGTVTCKICGNAFRPTTSDSVKSICYKCRCEYDATDNDTVESLYQTLKVRNGEIKELKSKQGYSKEVVEEYQRLADEKAAALAQATQELDKVKAEKDKLAKEDTEAINAANIRIASLEATITELQGGNDKLTKQVTTLQTDLNNKTAEAERLEQEITILDGKIAAAGNDNIDELIEERNEKIREANALAEEIVEKSNKINALNSTIQSNEATIESLNNDLSTLSTEKKELEEAKEKEAAELNALINERDNLIEQKRQEIDLINAKMLRKGEDNEKLQKELNDLIEDSERLLNEKNRTINEKNAKISGYESQLAENEKEATILKGKLAEANGGIAELQAEILRLTAELEEANSEINRLQNELTETEKYYEMLLKNFSDSLSKVVPENGGFTYVNTKTGDHFVCVNGHDFKYNDKPVTSITTGSGAVVDVYKTERVDGGEDFYFYIGEDGIHIVIFDDNGNVVSDIKSETKVEDLQNYVSGMIDSLTEELTDTKKELAELREGVANLYDYIKDILKELNIDFDIPDDPNPDPDPNGPTDNEDLKKLTEIMQMVRKVADKYKELETNYNKASSDYAEVIKAIYGVDENRKGNETPDVTPEQVIEQLKSEREEAKKKADELETELKDTKEKLDATEQEMTLAIATLTDTLNEEASKSNDEEFKKALAEAKTLNEQLKVASDQIKSLRASLDAMNSFVKTLATALGLDDIKDTAEILAAVNNLKEQVKDLTAQVETMAANNTALNNQVSSLTQQVNYLQSVNSDLNNQLVAANQQLEAYKASANGETAKLTQMVTDLSAENSVIKNENTTLKNGIDEIYAYVENSSNIPTPAAGTTEGKPYSTKISEIKAFYKTLVGNLDTANTKNKELYSKVKTLWDKKASLEEKLSKLSKENSTSTEKMRKLRAEIDSLNSQIYELKNRSVNSDPSNDEALLKENEELHEQIDFLNAEIDRLNEIIDSYETQPANETYNIVTCDKCGEKYIEGTEHTCKDTPTAGTSTKVPINQSTKKTASVGLLPIRIGLITSGISLIGLIAFFVLKKMKSPKAAAVETNFDAFDDDDEDDEEVE